MKHVKLTFDSKHFRWLLDHMENKDNMNIVFDIEGFNYALMDASGKIIPSRMQKKPELVSDLLPQDVIDSL